MSQRERAIILAHRQYPDDQLLRRLAHDIIVATLQRERMRR